MTAASVDLVAYSTPEEAYSEDLQPGFDKTPEGEGVSFTNSFGSSGDQSRAVEAGQQADVVHLSIEPDVTRLVDAGLVAEDWNQNEYDGIVQDSVVVFVTRPGNPKGVETWDDLITGDVEVLTPNPFTSGGARWNLMAAYGTKTITEGASEEEGLQYISDLLSNVSVQDESARDSLGTFLGGKGDVLLAYENEAIAAQDAGEDIEYVDPGQHAPDRDADRGPRGRGCGGAGLRRLPLHRRGPAAMGRQRLPAGDRVGAEAERRQVPDPAGPVHDRRPRRLGEGHHRVLRSGERQGGGDRA